MQTSLLPRYGEIDPTAFVSPVRVIVAAISFRFEILLRNRSSTNQGALRRERGKRTAHSKPTAASFLTTRISIFESGPPAMAISDLPPIVRLILLTKHQVTRQGCIRGLDRCLSHFGPREHLSFVCLSHRRPMRRRIWASLGGTEAPQHLLANLNDRRSAHRH